VSWWGQAVGDGGDRQPQEDKQLVTRLIEALRSAEARGGGRERQQSGGLAVRVAASRRAWRRCPRAAAICYGPGNHLCATARRRRRRRRRRPRAAAGHRPCRLLRAARRRQRRRRQLMVTAPGTRPAAERAREWGGGGGASLTLPNAEVGQREKNTRLYSNRARQERGCTGGEHAGHLQNPEMTRKPYERRKGPRQTTWQRRGQNDKEPRERSGLRLQRSHVWVMEAKGVRYRTCQ